MFERMFSIKNILALFLKNYHFMQINHFMLNKMLYSDFLKMWSIVSKIKNQFFNIFYLNFLARNVFNN